MDELVKTTGTEIMNELSSPYFVQLSPTEYLDIVTKYGSLRQALITILNTEIDHDRRNNK